MVSSGIGKGADHRLLLLRRCSTSFRLHRHEVSTYPYSPTSSSYGIEAIGDAVRYTHLAGRASRIGPNAELATIPQRPIIGQDPDSGAKDKIQQTLQPLAKVITLIRGLPHASLLRRRAALRAWSSLSKEDRVEQGTKKSQHDATMVSSAERKLWTIWRRTGVSGRSKAGNGGGGQGQKQRW
ncbi:hypothetical protein CF319_g9479 [Tilletia indica]|nr:hypothetical protein CF319_g9479 [Tilletia indica]